MLKYLRAFRQRKKRKKKEIPVVSLVGYTNAGKSTVMNNFVSKFSESENKEVFAITNVIATKKNGEFKLSNYIFESTKNWKSTDTSNIIYKYRQAYILSNEEVFLANKFYSNICSLFDIKPEKLTYFIAENCDNIYEILGYEYIFSKGMSEECGYFETKNN